MKSDDYHDYVIKDGKLIGDFEGMYQNSKEIPWHQNITCNYVSNDVLLELVRHYGPHKNLCDIGCGLGYFTERISRTMSGSTITGFDISGIATGIAKERLPHITFNTLDISKESKGNFDCVIVKDIMWYVFPNLGNVITNLDTMLSENGILIISQTFPPTKDYVGKEIIGDHEQLRDIFSERFDLLYYGTVSHKEVDFQIAVHLVYRKRGIK